MTCLLQSHLQQQHEKPLKEQELTATEKLPPSSCAIRCHRSVPAELLQGSMVSCCLWPKAQNAQVVFCQLTRLMRQKLMAKWTQDTATLRQWPSCWDLPPCLQVRYLQIWSKQNMIYIYIPKYIKNISKFFKSQNRFPSRPRLTRESSSPECQFPDPPWPPPCLPPGHKGKHYMSSCHHVIASWCFMMFLIKDWTSILHKEWLRQISILGLCLDCGQHPAPLGIWNAGDAITKSRTAANMLRSCPWACCDQCAPRAPHAHRLLLMQLASILSSFFTWIKRASSKAAQKTPHCRSCMKPGGTCVLYTQLKLRILNMILWTLINSDLHCIKTVSV